MTSVAYPGAHAKVTEGDGSSLRPVSGLQWIWRGQFETEVDGHAYAVDVDYFDWDERSRLYRDGEQVAVARNPARFEVGEDAHIETKMTLYGMSRAHLVTPAGEQQLELWSGSDWWAALTGWRPVAPVTLPASANLALTGAGVVAGLERALRLRHNWVLDE